MYVLCKFQRAIGRLKIFQVLSFVRHDRNKYMNKIMAILAFSCNCFGPLIKEADKVDDIIKKFQEDNDDLFRDMPEDFFADPDPLEDDDIVFMQ